jgi:hypothetical protein
MRNVFVFGCSIALVWQAKRRTRTTGREIERGPNEAANTMSPDIAMTAASLIETPASSIAIVGGTIVSLSVRDAGSGRGCANRSRSLRRPRARPDVPP